jgi:hypothetical protein
MYTSAAHRNISPTSVNINGYYGALHLVNFTLHGSYKYDGALHLPYFKD